MGRPQSAQAQLFTLASRAFPIVSDAYTGEFEARGASPLDGSLIRAAAGTHAEGATSIVTTGEPFDDIASKLEATGYSSKRGLYLAGPRTPKPASRVVADGGSGRVVFAPDERVAKEILARMDHEAEPGDAAEALQAVSGSVRLALIADDEGKSCVEALAAGQSASGRGAIFALATPGEKPDPDRFDSRALGNLDTGTPSVLVDSLLVPFNVTLPAEKSAEPIDEVLAAGVPRAKAAQVERAHEFPASTHGRVSILRLLVGSANDGGTRKRRCRRCGCPRPDGSRRKAQRPGLADVPGPRLGKPMSLAERRDVRAVVLSGEGPSFCSGLDFPSFMAGDIGVDEMIAEVPGEVANIAQRVAYAWQRLPMPVIAAIHGNCLGGGAQIAFGADIRIAGPDLKLCVMEIRYGLIPDMGISQVLPTLVSLDVAKEIVFTGRTIGADEALRLGLVTRLADDPVAEAKALATEIVSMSPHAIRSGKRLLNEAYAGRSEDALKLEAELQRALIGSPNQIAAVTAAMTKEPASYEDV